MCLVEEMPTSSDKNISFELYVLTVTMATNFSNVKSYKSSLKKHWKNIIPVQLEIHIFLKD